MPEKHLSDRTFIRFGRLIVAIESIEAVHVTPDLKRCIISTSGGSTVCNGEEAEAVWSWWCGNVKNVLPENS